MLMKILFALIALTVIVPVALYYKSGKTKGKECLLMNAISQRWSAAEHEG